MDTCRSYIYSQMIVLEVDFKSFDLKFKEKKNRSRFSVNRFISNDYREVKDLLLSYII